MYQSGGVGERGKERGSFRYDPLGRRIAAIYDNQPDATLDNDYVEFYGYDDAWRLTTVWRQGAVRASGAGEGSRPDPVLYERFLHNPGWGARLDAPMMSQVNDDWDELDSNGQPVTPNWDRTRTFVQDRFGNVIAVTDNGLNHVFPTVRISYDQLGLPILDSEYVGADIDGNNGVDGGDLAAFFAAFETGEEIADLNKDGGVDGGDLAVFFEWFESGFMGDHTLNDQRFLYRGYWWDYKLEMYHVRHRVYDPRRMIWLQRDPLGQLAGPDEYAYVMGEPRDYYDPMGLDKWLVSDPFYAVGLDSVGEYMNDLVDGAVEWKERTTGEAAKEDAKWHQVVDEQQDQVDCKLSQLVYDGKLSEEEAAKQGFAFHMQQDGDQGDVQQWSHYSKQTADQLTREVAITIVSAGVGNLAGRGLGVVGKWVFSSAAGRMASRWAARTGVSRATQWLAYWGNKPISSQFFKKSATGLLDDASTAAGRASSWTRSEFKGTRVYQRNDLIDPNLTNKLGRTNLQRMQEGTRRLSILTQMQFLLELTGTHLRHGVKLIG